MAQTDQEIIEINSIPVLPIPDEVMVGLGWKVGDVLTVDYDPESGFVTLSRNPDALGDEALENLDDLEDDLP